MFAGKKTIFYLQSSSFLYLLSSNISEFYRLFYVIRSAFINANLRIFVFLEVTYLEGIK